MNNGRLAYDRRLNIVELAGIVIVFSSALIFHLNRPLYPRFAVILSLTLLRLTCHR